MQYISLNNSSLTYFTVKGELSELSGSSKYNVFDNEIVTKEKRPNGKIENTTAIQDLLKFVLTDNSTDNFSKRLIHSLSFQIYKCECNNYSDEHDNNRLIALIELVNKYRVIGSDALIKLELLHSRITQMNSRYQKAERSKTNVRVLNKSKVRGKMYALFNLKCSRKFIAFYSVSFPLTTSDDMAFVCWNNWLTMLRKSYNLSNYIWVSERQKNGALHYHMLTNNYMPILQVNRLMAIVINNQVEQGLISWGGSSLDKYNGVDVDSVYNSKRHKKTGRNINPAQLREWLSKYITKYVTKNTEKFTHLAWHCSRSVSMLFTSTILLLSDSRKITDFLPRLRHLYINYKGDFNDTWSFKFVPPEHLFLKIRYYNDMIFAEYEPEKIERKIYINFKTKTL